LFEATKIDEVIQVLDECSK